MANNTCPLCGNKLKNGYCPDCGGNIETVCDAAESYEAHEAHADDNYNAFETYGQSDYTQELENNGMTARVRRSYTVSSENSAGENLKQLADAVKDVVTQNPAAPDNSEADPHRVIMIILAILIPVVGFILGMMFMKSGNRTVSPARQRTGKIMVIVSIVAFVLSQVFFPIIGGIFSFIFNGFDLI